MELCEELGLVQAARELLNLAQDLREALHQVVLERGVFSDRFSIKRLSYEQGKGRIAKQ